MINVHVSSVTPLVADITPYVFLYCWALCSCKVELSVTDPAMTLYSYFGTEYYKFSFLDPEVLVHWFKTYLKLRHESFLETLEFLQILVNVWVFTEHTLNVSTGARSVCTNSLQPLLFPSPDQEPLCIIHPPSSESLKSKTIQPKTRNQPCCVMPRLLKVTVQPTP